MSVTIDGVGSQSIDGGTSELGAIHKMDAGYGLDDWWSYCVEAISIVLSGGSVTYPDYDDRQITRTTGATTVTEYRIIIENKRGNTGTISFTSSDENVATVDGNGYVTYVSSGAVTITIEDSESVRSVVIPLQMKTSSTVVDEYTGPTVGSAREHIEDTITSALIGKVYATDKVMFSAKNPGTQSYTRNSGCWLTGVVNLTPLSVWNSTFAYHGNGIAITRRHIAFAAHFMLSVGSTIHFVTTDNQVVTRQLTAVLIHPLCQASLYDFAVGRLDSDLPESIDIARVLPTDYTDYLPGDGVELPVVWQNQFRYASLFTLRNFSSATTPDNLTWSTFSTPVILYDSGNPVFLIIGGKVVLLYVLRGGNYGHAVSSDQTNIQTLLDTIGPGGYTLTPIDLSSYATYS